MDDNPTNNKLKEIIEALGGIAQIMATIIKAKEDGWDASDIKPILAELLDERKDITEGVAVIEEFIPEIKRLFSDPMGNMIEIMNLIEFGKVEYAEVMRISKG